jgi:hypothetical protein
LLFFLAGIGACLRPPSPTGSSWAIVALLVTASVLLDANTLLDLRMRRRLRLYWDAIDMSHASERDKALEGDK